MGLTIISIGIFNGLMLALVFLRKKAPNTYLGLFILSHCIILFKYFNEYSLVSTFPVSLVGNVMEWVTAPLLYFYIKSYNHKPIPYSILHFIPAFIVTIIQLWNPGQVNSLLTDSLIISTCAAIQGMAYIIYQLREIKQSKWLKLLISLYAVEVTAIGLYRLIDLISANQFLPDIFIPVIIIIIINVMAFSSLMQSSLFNTTAPPKKNVSKNALIVQNTYETIKDHIETNERYLSPSIKLSDLSKELDLPEKVISQAINDCSGENINLFINRYRIKAAERLLIEQYQNFTIDAIAELSGFSNKVSFYKAFKKIHSISPKEYIEAQTTKQ
ncbi:MAG: helix-turn-helix domain-containing protein [Bacteroidota bacterium]